MNASTRVACFGRVAVALYLTTTTTTARAEDSSPPVARAEKKGRVGLGVEADVLPYLLSGAHGDVWVGVDGWRARAIAATSIAPSFFTPSGFENLRTTILELEVDRFFGPAAAEFRGPWVAGGGGLSLLSIDATDGSAHGATSAFELSAGVGWALPLPLNLYVDPWVGFTYQLTPTAVQVGAETWNPSRFGPVLGLKLGWNVLL